MSEPQASDANKKPKKKKKGSPKELIRKLTGKKKKKEEPPKPEDDVTASRETLCSLDDSPKHEESEKSPKSEKPSKSEKKSPEKSKPEVPLKTPRSPKNYKPLKNEEVEDKIVDPLASLSLEEHTQTDAVQTEEQEVQSPDDSMTFTSFNDPWSKDSSDTTSMDTATSTEPEVSVYNVT